MFIKVTTSLPLKSDNDREDDGFFGNNALSLLLLLAACKVAGNGRTSSESKSEVGMFQSTCLARMWSAWW